MYRGREKLFHISFQGSYCGPYFQSLIKEELIAGNLGQDAFLWSEDFAEWRALEQIPDFYAYQENIKLKTFLSADIEQRQQKLLESHEAQAIRGSSGEDIGNKRQTGNDEEGGAIASETSPSDEGSRDSTSRSRFQYLVSRRHLLMGSISLALCLSFVAGIFRNEGNYRDILSSLDVSPLQLRDVRLFLDGKGSHKALVYPLKKKKSDSTAVRLFVDWPDQSRVLIRFTGRRESLVRALSFETYAEVLLQGKTGATGPIHPLQGKNLPPGHYNVEISCLNCLGKNSKPIKVNKPVALGIHDQKSYKHHLEEFHQLLVTQAKSEIVELSEMVKFLNELMLPGQRSKSVLTMKRQLEEVLLNLNDSTANSSYVFANTYLRLKDVLLDINSGKAIDKQSLTDDLKRKIAGLERSVKNRRFLSE